MGRNISNLEISAKEKAEIAKQWLSQDIREDRENSLRYMLEKGTITEDEYWDQICFECESIEDESICHESEWDFFGEESF